MAATIETIVTCDVCGESNNGDDRYLTAAQIRKRRKATGWHYTNRLDFCPDCWKKRNAAQNKSQGVT
jgi:hypothetical protein